FRAGGGVRRPRSVSWRSGRSFFHAEDGIRDPLVTGVQTCALPICHQSPGRGFLSIWRSRQGSKLPCKGLPAPGSTARPPPAGLRDRKSVGYGKSGDLGGGAMHERETGTTTNAGKCVNNAQRGTHDK